MSLPQKIRALQTRFRKHPQVSFSTHGELIAVNVENRLANAQVFLQGAQVSSFRRKGERDLLWLSPSCDYKTANSLRGGIPICWPWFGEFSRNELLLKNQFLTTPEIPFPAHGFVRSVPWDFESVDDANPDFTTLTFGLSFDGRLPMWPFRSELRYRVSVGERLDISLTVKNIDELPQIFTEALHTYFAIGDHQQTTLRGLEGLEFIDAFADWKKGIQVPALGVGQPLNRVYLQKMPAAPVVIADGLWRRSLEIKNPEATSTVVWNPGVEHGKKLSCFPPDAHRGMVCVENGNVLERFVTLEAGKSHTLATQIRVI